MIAETAYDVPFIANDESGMSCFSAAMAMMVNATTPDDTLTLDEAIKLAGAVSGDAVWPARMLIELNNRGFETIMIEGFDGKDFIARGVDYLRDAFGDETADWQIKTSDIAKEQRDYQELFDSGAHVVNRQPQVEDIAQLLRDGWLVKCTVNSKRLNQQPGYVGHSIIVLSVNEIQLKIHDPGPPAKPNRLVDMEDFMAAWAYPNDSAKELIAIRKH